MLLPRMLLILVLLPWVLYSFGVAAVSVLAKSAAADAFAECVCMGAACVVDVCSCFQHSG